MQSDNNDSQKQKCCMTCAYYEPRSGFCRRNPPTPIAIPDKLGAHLMSAFPKIAIPNADFCYEFKPLVF